jgi:hypothetical protein
MSNSFLSSDMHTAAAQTMDAERTQPARRPWTRRLREAADVEAPAPVAHAAGDGPPGTFDVPEAAVLAADAADAPAFVLMAVARLETSLRTYQDENSAWAAYVHSQLDPPGPGYSSSIRWLEQRQEMLFQWQSELEDVSERHETMVTQLHAFLKVACSVFLSVSFLFFLKVTAFDLLMNRDF